MFYSTRLLRTAFAVAIALSAAAMPADAKDKAARPAAGSTARASVRIENFGRVKDHYYRGAQPRGNDYAALAALGIKTIVDLQEGVGDPNEARLARAAGITYYRIPMSTRRPPTATQLAQFFRLVNDPTRPVYVHCKGGRHRTGVMTAAYRMSFDGWTADRAFREMKDYDFGLDFLHPEFKEYVYNYDASRVATMAAATQQ